MAFLAWLRSSRIADRPSQPMKALFLEPVARPGLPVHRAEVPHVATSQDPSKTVLHIVVDLDELLGGVAPAEVCAPSPEHGVQVRDDHPFPLPRGDLVRICRSP